MTISRYGSESSQENLDLYEATAANQTFATLAEVGAAIVL
jgi:hypothetical protein